MIPHLPFATISYILLRTTKVWQNNITEQFHDLKWINIMVSFVYFYILLQANNQLVWITISNVWKLADHIQLKYWQ